MKKSDVIVFAVIALAVIAGVIVEILK